MLSCQLSSPPVPFWTRGGHPPAWLGQSNSHRLVGRILLRGLTGAYRTQLQYLFTFFSRLPNHKNRILITHTAQWSPKRRQHSAWRRLCIITMHVHLGHISSIRQGYIINYRWSFAFPSICSQFDKSSQLKSNIRCPLLLKMQFYDLLLLLFNKVTHTNNNVNDLLIIVDNHYKQPDNVHQTRSHNCNYWINQRTPKVEFGLLYLRSMDRERE